jgi:hypothetical protein
MVDRAFATRADEKAARLAMSASAEPACAKVKVSSDARSSMIAKGHEQRRPVTPGVNPLRFRCPISGRAIESDFSADAHTLSMIRLFSVRLHCPACDRLHEFKMVEALADLPADEAAEQAMGRTEGKPLQSGHHSRL